MEYGCTIVLYLVKIRWMELTGHLLTAGINLKSFHLPCWEKGESPSCFWFRPTTFWNGPVRTNFTNCEQVDLLEKTELQQSPSRRGDETSTSAIEYNPATDTAIAPFDDYENNPFENNNGSTINSDDLNVAGNAFSTARLPFLDKLKMFLTALVVTHHETSALGWCAFGGLAEAKWY